MKKITTLVLCVFIICSFLFVGVSCDKKQPTAFKLIDVKLTDENYAIAIGKGKTELKNQINNALAEIDVDAIIEKYQDMESVEKGYDIPNSADGIENPLIVATNAEFAPFEYKKGAQYFGIDVEIAVALAEKLGKTLVLVNMNFDAIITSVAGVNMDEGVSNDGYDAYTHCDIGIAGLSVTEERLDSVDFTNTYFKSSQVLIVNENDVTFDECKTLSDVETLLAGFSNKKIGSQSGTTGEYYIKGSGDWLKGFLNITFKGYSSHALAVQDLINGNIDFVISDYETAKAVVANYDVNANMRWQKFVKFFFTYKGYLDVVDGLKNTLIIAFLGLIIGIVIGTVIASIKIIPYKNCFQKVLSSIGDFYVWLFRGTPIAVQLLLIYYVALPLMGLKVSSIIVAIITYGLNSGAYVSEIMRSGLSSVDGGQMEAGRALGLSYGKTMFKIVIPQAIKNILPTLGNEFIALLKETSVVGFIAVTDITKAFQSIAGGSYEYVIPYCVLAICYLVLVSGVTLAVKLMEKRFKKSDRSC